MHLRLTTLRPRRRVRRAATSFAGAIAFGLASAGADAARPMITDANLIGDLYAYVPASFSFRDDRLVVHTNLGWLHERATGRDRMTWGVGSETRLSERAWLIAEAFGQNQGKAFYQFGLRYWLVPNRVQIDTTYGSRAGLGAEQRWFSIGLRLLSAPFLP